MSDVRGLFDGGSIISYLELCGDEVCGSMSICSSERPSAAARLVKCTLGDSIQCCYGCWISGNGISMLTSACPLCIRSVPFRELSRFLGPAGGLHLHGCRRTLIPRQPVRILLPGGFTTETLGRVRYVWHFTRPAARLHDPVCPRRYK